VSDLFGVPSLLQEYIENPNNKPEKKTPSMLEEYVQSASVGTENYLAYENEELNTFMHSPAIVNRLTIAENPDKESAQLANTFLISKELNIPIDKVMSNYEQYSRSFFGDSNPTSSLQAYKDSFNRTFTNLKVSTLGEKLRTGDYTDEEREDLLEQQRLLNYGLPPQDNATRTTVDKMLHGAFGQTANWAYALLGVTPIEDIKEGVDKAKKEGTDTFFGGLSGIGKYIQGLTPAGAADPGEKPEGMTYEEFFDTPSFQRALSRSGHVEPQAFFAFGKVKGAPAEWMSRKLLTKGAPFFLSRWQQYSQTESGSMYNELSSIEGPDGQKLDESHKIALSGIVGQLSSAAEAFGDQVVLSGGKSLQHLYGLAFKKQSTSIASGMLDTVMGKAVKKLFERGIIPTSTEVLTEELQAGMGMITHNLAITMEENSNLFEDAKITPEMAMAEFKTTGIMTFMDTIPIIVLTGGFAELNSNIKGNKQLQAEIKEVVKAIALENGDLGFKELNEVIMADPRMEKYSDRAIEKEASRVILSDELKVELGKAPDETITDYTTKLEEKMLTDFKQSLKAKPVSFLEGSEEYNKLFEQFKKDNIDQYYAPLKMDEASLRAIYERDHVNKSMKTEVQAVPIYDEAGKPVLDKNGDQDFRYEEIQVPSGEEISFEDFLKQRRTMSAYVNNWVHTPDAKKYLANMQPSVDVIKRTLLENNDPVMQEKLGKISEKIQKLVTNAQEGTGPATINDLDIENQMENEILDNRIKELEAVGRENRKDKNALAAINEKIKELIRTKFEINSSQGQILHALETVSREIFNKNRIQRNLESIHERLIQKIEEYDGNEFQDFLSGKIKINKMMDIIKKSITDSAELANDKEIQQYLDINDSEINVFEDLLKDALETGKNIESVDNFKKLIISKMQKALSNYLKLNGEKMMEAITYPVESTVSQSAKDKIESIQAAILKVEKAVSPKDIEKAKGFIDYLLLAPEDKGFSTSSLSSRIKNINKKLEEPASSTLLTNWEGRPYEINYNFSSDRVAGILLNSMKITYDENATAIKPKLSLNDLIELKTEIDLLRFIGKLELAEAHKNNLITDEIRKSEFLSSQKSITNMSKKDRKILSALNFDTMSSHDWAYKLFGDNGIEMFFTEKNIADNNARLEKNRRTAEVLKKLDMTEREIANSMFEEIEHEGVSYSVQQLMYYYIGKSDSDIYHDLRYGNGIPVSLLGEFEGESKVDSLLSDKQKKIADVLHEDLMNAWNRTAGVYEASSGRRLGKIFNYLPKPVRDQLYDTIEEDVLETMFRGTDYENGAVNKSMTYERRISTEDNALAIQDGLWDIWQNYIHKQEHYIAHARWVEQAKRFMADSEVKNTIAENYNPAWVQGIDKYISDVANPSALHGATGTDELLRNLRHNTAVSALGGRLGIIARQIPSLMMYLSEAGLKEFSSAIVEYNRNFYMDGFKMKNHIQDMIMELDPTSIDTKVGYDLLHYKYQKNKAKQGFKDFQDAGMAGIYWMDRNIKATGWLSLYNKNKNTLGKEKAIQIARDYTVLYQPSGDKTTLPGMYRHSDIMNMALMFTQQPVKIFNYTRNNVYPNLTSKDGNKVAGVYGLLSIMAMNTAIWSLTQKRVPEDPEDWIIATSIGSVGVIPWVGKTIQNELSGRTTFKQSITDAPITAVFELLNIKEWKDAMDDPEKLAKKIKTINKGIGISFGTPSEFINDIIDFSMTGDPTHVILGGERGVKK